MHDISTFGYITLYPFIDERLGFKILTEKGSLKSIYDYILRVFKNWNQRRYIWGSRCNFPVLLKTDNQFIFSLSV